MRNTGPVPKHSSQRRRRNADSVPDRARAGASVAPPEIREDIHPMAAAWYEALQVSGQAQFYEASDWLQAQIVAEAIDRFMAEGSAALLNSILSASGSLLVTEGDRRRLRLELVREERSESPAPRPARRLKAVDVTAG